MRSRLLWPALILVGCAPPNGPAEVTVSSGRPPSVFAGLKVSMENRSRYYVSIEPLSAQRTGGSNGFGPPEKTQPGNVKIASRSELGNFFGGVDSVPSSSPPELVFVHIEAREGDTGPIVKEAYVAVSQYGLEKSPGTLKIKTDAKGVTWFGPAAGSQAWIEVGR